MKTKYIILGIVAAFILMVAGKFITVNNRAISLEEQIFSTDADVQVQEKRRNDLIYNLADCVKAYDKHEAKTLIQLAEARSQGENAKIEGNVMAHNAAVAEDYPELKSNENYKELMNELSITENKIAEARITYNSQIKGYNKYVRRFPHKQILDMMGYNIVEYKYLEYGAEDRAPVKGLFDEE